jgi:hypothetical protein
MSDLKKRMSEILEEIAPYEIALEDDPTLPHLGTRYLQKLVSDCRKYLNRVTYYYQEVAREERTLRTGLKASELDLEFKTKQLLADDPVVRQQPSISDREALAATMLKDEHMNVATLRIDLMDVQETLKLVKFKHQELQRTSQDIKMQRSLVRDDATLRMAGEVGYDKPVIGPNGMVLGGLAAPVKKDDLNPTDILNPDTRPDYLPEPVDSMHAKMIAEFYSDRPSPKDKVATEDPKVVTISYDDLLL